MPDTAHLIDAVKINPPVPEGIFDPLDLADELEQMFVEGLPPGFDVGFKSLYPFYRVQPGNWTIITGIPGSGKSTLLDNILVNLSKLHGWKHLICSPENQPIKNHIASIAAIHAGREFRQGSMSMDEYADALTFIQDHFRFIYPPEKDFTGDRLIELAEWCESTGFDFTGFVVDPYNELEHKRQAGVTETEYVSWLLSRFRRYARDHNKHLWLVAHPTKLRKVEKKFGQDATQEEMTKAVFPIPTLYDISGSAHFFNKADMGLSVYRDKSVKDSPTEVHVQKVRFRHTGTLGTALLKFDWKSGRYSDV